MKQLWYLLGALVIALPGYGAQTNSGQQALGQPHQQEQLRPKHHKHHKHHGRQEQLGQQEEQQQEESQQEEEAQQKLPRMLIVKCKKTGQGKQMEESEAQVIAVDEQKKIVTDDASAKQAIDGAKAQKPIVLSEEQEESLPDGVSGIFESAQTVANDPLGQPAPNRGRWSFGASAGHGRYFVGYGSRPYYGYNRYYRYASPSYGYYYRNSYYPYAYDYSYSDGDSNYYFYSNPYYDWD